MCGGTGIAMFGVTIKAKGVKASAFITTLVNGLGALPLLYSRSRTIARAEKKIYIYIYIYILIKKNSNYDDDDDNDDETSSPFGTRALD
jgi:hypothetical protein